MSPPALPIPGQLHPGQHFPPQPRIVYELFMHFMPEACSLKSGAACCQVAAPGLRSMLSTNCRGRSYANFLPRRSRAGCVGHITSMKRLRQGALARQQRQLRSARLAQAGAAGSKQKKGSIKNCSPGRKFAILVGTLDHKLHIFP